MNRKRYPKNWNQIALAVKEKADWKCEWCDRPCRRPEESQSDLVHRLERDNRWHADLYDGETAKPGRFTLTVAHLDHDPENPNARLAALCSVCHCRYDLKEMRRKQAIQDERSGQLRLL